MYHIGVHCTDEQKLVQALRANAPALAEQGIIVPDPQVYRPMLREVMKAMGGKPSSTETEETILDAVMVEDRADRLIFSNDMILSLRQRAVVRGRLYPTASEKISALANLLPSHECEICMAIRNPATFVPSLFQAGKMPDYDQVMEGGDPRALSWAEMIIRIRADNPDLPLTIWCDEDTPLIWPEVLQAVSGHDGTITLSGADQLLEGIMTEEGIARLRAYLEENPAPSPEYRCRIACAFLDKYAREDAIELELDLPGWDEAMVTALTEAYDREIETIASMDGVRFILP